MINVTKDFTGRLLSQLASLLFSIVRIPNLGFTGTSYTYSLVDCYTL